jgi:hypothetical protein
MLCPPATNWYSREEVNSIAAAFFFFFFFFFFSLTYPVSTMKDG